MMGSTHAATGAAAWLAGCATAAAFGYDPGAYVVIVGTPLAAFGAIWPDIDCPSSNVARSLGWPTRWGAELVAWFGRWLHDRTRAPLDGRDRDGHRTITHTVLFAVLSFVGFGALGQYGGTWAPVVMTVVAAATGTRALLRPRNRYERIGVVRVPVAWVVGLAVAAAGVMWPPPSGWWLGWAIGGGALVHNLGDRMTNTGVPLAFPWKIQGRRWYKFRSAAWCRFETGTAGNPEPAIRWVSIALCAVALFGVAYFRWPPFADGLGQLVAALADEEVRPNG